MIEMVVAEMMDDRVEEIKVVVAEEEVVAAAEITFLNVMEIGHAVVVQIKISHGEMNAIGRFNM